MSDLPQRGDLPDGRKTIYDCERAKLEGLEPINCSEIP